MRARRGGRELRRVSLDVHVGRSGERPGGGRKEWRRWGRGEVLFMWGTGGGGNMVGTKQNVLGALQVQNAKFIRRLGEMLEEDRSTMFFRVSIQVECSWKFGWQNPFFDGDSRVHCGVGFQAYLQECPRSPNSNGMMLHT